MKKSSNTTGFSQLQAKPPRNQWKACGGIVISRTCRTLRAVGAVTKQGTFSQLQGGFS